MDHLPNRSWTDGYQHVNSFTPREDNKDVKYRREIDGLRALAVIPVMLFHAGFQAFSGGFVGVDVFFVISGYLITTVILSEKEAGTFSLVNFYERRARRILPALFVVMAASIPFAWFWLLPAYMKEFSDSVIAVSAFASNFLFWKTDEYFDTAVTLQPLIHTWSLAVEEQYYLIFPIFIMLTWRFGKRWVAPLLVLIAVASLGVADWGARHHTEATYYLLPTRAWELAIGALVAIYLSRIDRAEAKPTFHQAASVFGFALIWYSALAFTTATPFPSLYALAPTLGAALIILYASPSTFVGRLLGTRMFVGIGLVSYSAYLWHQPLFAFARHRSLGEVSRPLFILLIAASFLLAYLSWRYVEKPARNRALLSRKQIFLAALACSLCFIGFGVAGYISDGYIGRQPYFLYFSKLRKAEQSKCYATGRRTAKQIAAGDFCVLGDAKTTPSFAVIGDSHAAAIFEALEDDSIKHRRSFWAISGGWCPPIANGFDSKAWIGDDCIATTDEAFKKITLSPSIRVVVLVAEWANYTRGYRDTEAPRVYGDRLGAAGSSAENALVFDRSLMATVDSLKAAGKSISVVEPGPEFEVPVSDTIEKRLLFNGSTGAVDDILSYAPTVSVKRYETRNADVFMTFSKLRNVRFVRTKELFCSASMCSSVDARGQVLFSDSNHVTQQGATLIVDQIARYLDQM